jgi:hypothetical protein
LFDLAVSFTLALNLTKPASFTKNIFLCIKNCKIAGFEFVEKVAKRFSQKA